MFRAASACRVVTGRGGAREEAVSLTRSVRPSVRSGVQVHLLLPPGRDGAGHAGLPLLRADRQEHPGAAPRTLPGAGQPAGPGNASDVRAALTLRRGGGSVGARDRRHDSTETVSPRAHASRVPVTQGPTSGERVPGTSAWQFPRGPLLPGSPAVGPAGPSLRGTRRCAGPQPGAAAVGPSPPGRSLLRASLREARKSFRHGGC